MKGKLSALLLLLAAPLLAQVGEVAWELRVTRDLPAPVVRGAVDADGKAVWLATHAALFRVGDGRAQPASKQPAADARLLLAPGGGVYAWVVPDENLRNPTTRITLHRTSGEMLAELKTEPAAGLEVMFLAFRGKAIVTAAPLDDPEGTRGRFRLTFWALDGRALASALLDERPNLVFAQDGSAALHLGAKSARAFTSEGRIAWTLAGAFRKAAICCGGARAVLNPSEAGALSNVVFAEGDHVVGRVAVPTAVHHLAMSPGGETVIAAGDMGRWFQVARGRRPRERRAPATGRLIPYIFDLEVPAADTVVFGILHRAGEQRGAAWPAGSILAVRRNGSVLFRRDFEIADPSGFVPNVDIAPGEKTFVGRTREAVILGTLEGE